MARKIPLSVVLFGRRYTIGEWVVTIISLSAASLTLLQNLAPQSELAIGIQTTVTKTPTNTWMLVLGALLMIITLMYIKKKK